MVKGVVLGVNDWKVGFGLLELYTHTVLVLLLTVVLGALLRIDRDTLHITSVATIMSPAFVAPVADKLENREVVITGIASGLMGCAVANYVGILLAWWLS